MWYYFTFHFFPRHNHKKLRGIYWHFLQINLTRARVKMHEILRLVKVIHEQDLVTNVFRNIIHFLPTPSINICFVTVSYFVRVSFAEEAFNIQYILLILRCWDQSSNVNNILSMIL